MSTTTTTKPSITAPDVFAQLTKRFDTAREAGDLLFFESTVVVHDEGGVEFQIRVCPALLKKPTLPTPHFETPATTTDSNPTETKSAKSDPFAEPYVPSLHVGDIEYDDDAVYAVLLNKFSVVPYHFLLVTKDFQSQASPLFPPDLTQSYLLLQSAKKARQNFFAFYNCGENSGASQPHKHVQFIPVEEDYDVPPVEELAKAAQLESQDKPFSLEILPYANYVRRLPKMRPNTPVSIIEDTLSQAFLSLLDIVIQTVRHDPTYPPGPPSYNLILTLEHIHVIPRKTETYVLRETGEKISVNALGFAGMVLVKSEEELEAVRKEGVLSVLKGVAVGKEVSDKVVDPHTEREVKPLAS